MAGIWVGFAEHCGDSLTHMVLDAVTLKIIYRSALRPRTPKDPNIRLVDAGGEEDNQPHENPLTIQIKSQIMVQPQASLCQDSTLMTLLEGPFYYLLETMGESLMPKVTRKLVEDIE